MSDDFATRASKRIAALALSQWADTDLMEKAGAEFIREELARETPSVEKQAREAAIELEAEYGDVLPILLRHFAPLEGQARLREAAQESLDYLIEQHGWDGLEELPRLMKERNTARKLRSALAAAPEPSANERERLLLDVLEAARVKHANRECFCNMDIPGEEIEDDVCCAVRVYDEAQKASGQ